MSMRFQLEISQNCDIMYQWAWKNYVTSRNVGIVKEWHDEVNALVWLEFRATLEHLDGQPPANWIRPYVGTLKKECANGS